MPHDSATIGGKPLGIGAIVRMTTSGNDRKRRLDPTFSAAG